MAKLYNSIFSSRYIWLRLLKHFVIVVILAIITIICLGYLSLNQVSKEFVKQVLLSMLAADIFYVCTDLLPKQHKKKQIFQIVVSILNSSIDNYLNCLLYILSKHGVNIKDLVKTHDFERLLNPGKLNKIIATDYIWEEHYQEHDWREIISLKAKDINEKCGKDIELTKAQTTYHEYFIAILNDLEHNIDKCLKRYSTILDSEYVALLERVNNSFLIIQRNEWDRLANPDYVNYNLELILSLEQLNERLRKKYCFKFEYYRER